MAASSLIAWFKDGRPLRAQDLIRAVEATPTLAEEIDRSTGNTVLHYACCNGAPLPVITVLINAFPAAVRKTDADGNLPVTGAVSNGGSAEVVSALLTAYPASIKIKQGAEQHTLLHYAACSGQSHETAAALIKAWPGAAAERDADGNAPLHFAAACQATPLMVQAILAACPESAKWRGAMGRLPLSLCLLCEAPPGSVEAIRDAYPEAQRAEEIIGDYQNHGLGIASKFPQGSAPGAAERSRQQVDNRGDVVDREYPTVATVLPNPNRPSGTVNAKE